MAVTRFMVTIYSKNNKKNYFFFYNKEMQERGLIMLSHSALIGLILFVVMFVIGVDIKMNEDLSILIASITLMYMLIFGHSLPSTNTLNKNIFK